jgi:hypothetical protein
MFEELSWFHFQQLERIKKLPLHEQVLEFDKYINETSINRMAWLANQQSADNALRSENSLILTAENDIFLMT